MKASQLLLIGMLVILQMVYFIRLRNKVLTLLFFLLLFSVGILFVFNPGILIVIANYVGIGRGADLILYLGIIAAFMGFLSIYSKLRRIEINQTHIIRDAALRQARRKE